MGHRLPSFMAMGLSASILRAAQTHSLDYEDTLDGCMMGLATRVTANMEGTRESRAAALHQRIDELIEIMDQARVGGDL